MQIGGRVFLGTSGQTVADLKKVTCEVSAGEVAEGEGEGGASGEGAASSSAASSCAATDDAASAADNGKGKEADVQKAAAKVTITTPKHLN